MFQSSRIASGSPRLQASRAFSPSSASTIWKSSPSRIRLATFRMTLESSTTRHVLIFSLYSFQSRRDVSLPVTPSCRAALRSQQGRYDFEDPIDIEDDHELTIEPMHAAGQLRQTRIEIDGIFLAAIVGKPQHLADLVDQQPIGFAAQVDAEGHRRLAVLILRQPEPRPHVHHGHDASTQVKHAGDLGW